MPSLLIYNTKDYRYVRGFEGKKQNEKIVYFGIIP